MILPNVRASFGREEARWLVVLLERARPEGREHWESVLSERGVDALLDDPRTYQAILQRADEVELLPPRLVLYVLLRRTLLEGGIESRLMADYVTALVLEFGMGDRSRRIAEYDDREYGYLVDILEDLTDARGRRAFLLQAHLGNFALWLSGLFPDYIAARMRRRGGPGLDYYEEMGQAGYRMAADAPHARRESLDGLFRDAAEAFRHIRRSLNRASDRFFFPVSEAPVERLLRQARDGFDTPGRLH